MGGWGAERQREEDDWNTAKVIRDPVQWKTTEAALSPFPSSGKQTNGRIHVGTKRLCSPQSGALKNNNNTNKHPTITPRTGGGRHISPNPEVGIKTTQNKSGGMKLNEMVVH